MQPTNADQLLTPAEVAAMLFVDPKTVTRWASGGRIGSIPWLMQEHIAKLAEVGIELGEKSPGGIIYFRRIAS